MNTEESQADAESMQEPLGRDREAWNLPRPEPSPIGPVADLWPSQRSDGNEESRKPAA